MNEIGYGALGVPTVQLDLSIARVERNAEPLGDCCQSISVDDVAVSQFRVIVRA
jgi:hypothetical protein